MGVEIFVLSISEFDSFFSLDFSNKVLDISSGIDDVGGLRWELVAYLALAWITVYFVVWKGLHNSGKVMLEIFLLF